MNKRNGLQDLDKLVTMDTFKISPPVKVTDEHTDDEVIGMKLHPLYASKFMSIFGITYSIKNLMSILGTDDKFFNLINVRMTTNEIIKISKHKKRYDDSYWPIIKLNLVDRLFSDRSLLVYLLVNYDRLFIKSKAIVTNITKRGLMKTEVTDNITLNYVKVIKEILTEILHEYKEVDTNSINSLDKTKFKELKNNVKLILFKEIQTLLNKQILSNVTDDELLEAYLK